MSENNTDESRETQPGGYWILIVLVFMSCVFAMFLVLGGKWHLKRFSDDENFEQKSLPDEPVLLPKIIEDEKK